MPAAPLVREGMGRRDDDLGKSHPNVWGSGDYIIGMYRVEKVHIVLFKCISVTDGIKINKQNKSIGIGPLYLQTEFEAI